MRFDGASVSSYEAEAERSGESCRVLEDRLALIMELISV